MSKTDFQKVVRVTVVVRGMQTLNELVGEAPMVVLKTEKARRQWARMLKLYEKFNAMTLEERAKFAEVQIDPSPGDDSTLASPQRR